MANAAVIVLADSVPANRNYNPVNVSGNVAVHTDTATALTPAGQSSFSLKLRPATNTLARKVDLDFALPVEYTDTNTGNILTKDTFRHVSYTLVPPNATALQIANFEALVRNLYGHATYKAYVKNGEPEF